MLHVLPQISTMLLFVRSYKQEVLGVGEVALAAEVNTLLEAATQRGATGSTDRTAEETQHVRPQLTVSNLIPKLTQ